MRVTSTCVPLVPVFALLAPFVSHSAHRMEIFHTTVLSSLILLRFHFHEQNLYVYHQALKMVMRRNMQFVPL
jgi:uncharacterized membrane protein (GlpM family)